MNSGKPVIVSLAAISVALLVCVVVEGVRLTAVNAKLRRGEARAQVAEAIAREVTAKADAAIKTAENVRLREEEKLHTLYKNLWKVRQGENPVNDGYIDSFNLNNGLVKVKLVNNTSKPITPSFGIFFLDENGFVSGNATFTWTFSTIEPGETRFDEASVHYSFGSPVYYTVRRGPIYKAENR